jgi:hypothetical protein
MQVGLISVAKLALNRLHIFASLDRNELGGPTFGHIFVEKCAQGIEKNMVHINT